MDHLENIFNAKSVAIVGVSEDPKKIGSAIFTNLLSAGFEGKVFQVNPKYKTLNNRDCYPDIASIPEDIDVVCIAVPKVAVKDIVNSCAQKGVKSVIIITAGFGEIDEEGKKLETEILEIAKKANMRILGPNCLGYMTSKSQVNLSFAARNILPGNVAFISQSGAICTALLDMSVPKNFGFSHFLSIGNKVDINEIDLLKYFSKDDDTHVIGAYLEEFSSGLSFLKTYQSSDSPKPFIILKPGKTNEAKKAIQSHTGSIAGQYEVYSNAIRENGMILVDSLRSMLNHLIAFSWCKPVSSDRVAIVTNAGGPSIFATDCIVEKGLKIATLSDNVRNKIKEFLPETASVHNPIDVLGDALADRYENTIREVINDENVDVILVLLTPQRVTQIQETAQAIVRLSALTSKLIIPVFLGDLDTRVGCKLLIDNKIPAFEDISDAVEVIHSLVSFYSWKSNRNKSILNSQINLGKGIYRSEILELLSKGITSVPEPLMIKMVNEVALPLPPQELCSDAQDAIHFAKDKYPVVIKAPNSLISHKTDVKALFTNIKDDYELVNSFSELKKTIVESSGREPEYILVQKQMDKEEELIIGVNRDGDSNVYTTGKGFGHLMLFGKGGIYTEIFKDYGFTLLPSSMENFIKTILKTKVSRILLGARGHSQLAITQLLLVMESISKLVMLYPEIESIDINPLFIDENSVLAIDVKIFIKL